MKHFPLLCRGMKILRASFMGNKTILLEKILDEVIDQRLMNHLTSMKIASDNLVVVHISMSYAQRLLDGMLDHFAER